jgi:hypothetical protein
VGNVHGPDPENGNEADICQSQEAAGTSVQVLREGRSGSHIPSSGAYDRAEAFSFSE